MRIATLSFFVVATTAAVVGLARGQDEPSTDQSQPAVSMPDSVPQRPPTYEIPHTGGYGTFTPPPKVPDPHPLDLGGSIGVRYPPKPPPAEGVCHRNGVTVPC